jgi:hypothetical protein
MRRCGDLLGVIGENNREKSEKSRLKVGKLQKFRMDLIWTELTGLDRNNSNWKLPQKLHKSFIKAQSIIMKLNTNNFPIRMSNFWVHSQVKLKNFISRILRKFLKTLSSSENIGLKLRWWQANLWRLKFLYSKDLLEKFSSLKLVFKLH